MKLVGEAGIIRSTSEKLSMAPGCLEGDNVGAVWFGSLFADEHENTEETNRGDSIASILHDLNSHPDESVNDSTRRGLRVVEQLLSYD